MDRYGMTNTMKAHLQSINHCFFFPLFKILQRRKFEELGANFPPLCYLNHIAAAVAAYKELSGKVKW